MTVESGPTKGGPAIVDAGLNVTGNIENNTNEIPVGSSPKILPVSSIRVDIIIEGHNRC
jgi:hypothetical protein